jgi:hypothetical protein
MVNGRFFSRSRRKNETSATRHFLHRPSVCLRRPGLRRHSGRPGVPDADGAPGHQQGRQQGQGRQHRVEVRTIFDKAAQIDDIKSIAGKDLEVTKDGDKIVVAFAYTKEIHMAGPAFLLLKYNGKSK